MSCCIQSSFHPPNITAHVQVYRSNMRHSRTNIHGIQHDTDYPKRIPEGGHIMVILKSILVSLLYTLSARLHGSFKQGELPSHQSGSTLTLTPTLTSRDPLSLSLLPVGIHSNSHSHSYQSGSTRRIPSRIHALLPPAVPLGGRWYRAPDPCGRGRHPAAWPPTTHGSYGVQGSGCPGGEPGQTSIG